MLQNTEGKYNTELNHHVILLVSRIKRKACNFIFVHKMVKFSLVLIS